MRTGKPLRSVDERDGRINEIHEYPVPDNSGKTTRVAVFARDITDKVKADNLIKASLAEKEVLLQEIHHRVKNNLQVVSSILTMQALASGDQRVTEAFAESQRRIKVMALAHDRLTESEDLANIGARIYLGAVIDDFRKSLGPGSPVIAVETALDDIMFGPDQAIPCGQIVSELLSNVGKHAFPDGKRGSARVRLGRAGERIELSVSDDGRGLPAAFDWRKTETLGFRLVAALADKLGGKMEIGHSRGSHITITFPEGPQ